MNITTETKGVVERPAPQPDKIAAELLQIMAGLSSTTAAIQIETFAEHRGLRVAQKDDSSGVYSPVPEFKPVIFEEQTARWSFEVNGDGPAKSATIGIFATEDGSRIWLIYSLNVATVAPVPMVQPSAS